MEMRGKLHHNQFYFTKIKKLSQTTIFIPARGKGGKSHLKVSDIPKKKQKKKPNR